MATVRHVKTGSFITKITMMEEEYREYFGPY